MTIYGTPKQLKLINTPNSTTCWRGPLLPHGNYESYLVLCIYHCGHSTLTTDLQVRVTEIFKSFIINTLTPHLAIISIVFSKMVLVGYTGSWWCPSKAQSPRLGFNLNWVVVLGIPE